MEGIAGPLLPFAAQTDVLQTRNGRVLEIEQRHFIVMLEYYLRN